MRNKDPMDSMKELNEVLKRKKELDLTDNQVDEIMEAGNEWIFQRDPDNLFVPTKDKPKTLFDDEVEEVTTGPFTTNNDKNFVSRYKNQLKKETEEGIGSLTDDLEEIDISQGMVDLDELNFTKNAKAAKEAIDNKSSTQVFKDDKGGIKGISIGGDDEFKKGVSEAMEEGMRESENMKRLGLDPASQKDFFIYEDMKEAGQLEKNVAGLADMSESDTLMQKYPGMTKQLADQIANDPDPNRKAHVISMVEQTLEMGSKGMSGDEIIEIFKKAPRTKQAGGGPITSTGLNYLLGEDDNNRVPYASGGRRGFLKLLAGLGAAGAAFKTGLMSLKGGAKPIAKEIAKEAATGQPPAYFLNLVAKIKTLGDDAPRLETLDRQKVTTYKDYTLTEDVTTGRQEVSRMKVDEGNSGDYYGQPLTEETYMSYTPGEEIFQETAKGKTKIIKSSPEYEEGTAYIRSDRGNAGDIVDESAEISEDVIREGTPFEDNLSDFGKADGGRINHAAGGIAKLIKKLNDIAPGSTKLGSTSKKLSKKADDKRALQQAIRDFEKRTKTKNPLGLSEEFIRGLNKKVKKQMGE
jgi:hypothetical protein